MKLFGSIKELVSAVFRANSQEVTLRPNQSTTYTAARDVQLPPQDSNAVLMSADSTQTVTNKSIDADSNTITNIDNADIKAGAAIARSKLADGTADHVLINSGTGVMSSEPQLATTRGGTGQNSSATFPTSGTVATDSNTLAFTNKTFDADGTGNSITNIEDADIKAGANINATKIGTGVVDNTEFNKLNSAGTNAAGELVTTDGTQTLSGKSFSDNTAWTGTGAIDIPSGTTAQQPGSPSAGMIRFNTDASSFEGYNGSSWGSLGGGGQGGINYIAEDPNGTAGNSDFEADTNGSLPSGWARYANAAAATPVDGTGGAPNAAFTYTAQTSTIIRGTKSAKISKDGNNRQGHGVSYDFDIDAADVGKVLHITCDVDASTSSTYVDDYLAVYIIADRGSPTLITPSYTGIKKAKYAFQASFLATTATTYRLVFHVADSTATAWDVYLDNVSVGPEEVIQSAPVSEWFSYTPTLTGFGTPSSVSFFYRRVGSSLEIKGAFTSGIPTATEARLSLPTGLTVDSSFLGSSATNPVGNYFQNKGTADQKGGAIFVEPSVTYLTFGHRGTFGTTAVDALGKANGNVVIENGDSVRLFTAAIPISQWAGSSVGLSNSRVEYASNASTADADDLGTANFTYGPSGSLVPTITAGFSTFATKRVRFLTPIQSTDKFELQIQTAGTGPWIAIGDLGFSSDVAEKGYAQFSFQDNAAGGSNNRTYGIGLRRVSGSNNDLDVLFARGGAGPNGVGYSTTGANYPTTANDRWRVVKSSNPLSIGGSAAEYYLDSSATLYTNTAANIISRTLQPGTWRVDASTTINSGVVINTLLLSISTTSATHATANQVRIYGGSTTGTASGSTFTVLNLSSATVVYIVGNGNTSVTVSQDTRALFTKL